MTDGLHLGKVKITGYHLIQNPQFFLRQIILSNPNIFCRGKIPGKGGKPHKWLIRIGPLIDHFRSRMSMRLSLIHISIKYTESGSICVGVQLYELFARVDVTDTGIGIAEAEQRCV